MRYYILIGALFLLSNCSQKIEEVDIKKSHPSHVYNFVNADEYALNYYETVYVPVYSDIYHLDGTRRFKLTTTVSIRNTSLSDSAFILSATYHDSYGKTLKEYVDSTILVSPLESIEFVVEEFENMGGAGANFIVEWASNNHVDQLLIQSIMIGTYDKQGISFLSESKVIKRVIKD
ncbi:MAG: DUF3124 domain-containing protein [Bacteroidales bacterium]|nr:DUF3124 domain-containing protein [Bacteroidales bacterium]